MKAIRVHEQGSPDVMRYEDVPDPTPGPGQVLVKQSLVGVNFADIYNRSGLYKINLPYTPGGEGSGTITAIGEGVTNVKVGDLVAYGGAAGAYAELTVGSASSMIKLPPDVDPALAMACLMQGNTAYALAYAVYPIKPGDRVLIHAAAGGVGSLLVQMAKRLGAYVFATVSTDEKAAYVRELGADEVINYSTENFAEAVKKSTSGQGVQAVYDAVGVTTWEGSLDCLAPRGFMLAYGQSAGPVPPFTLDVLRSKTIFVTRPGGGSYPTDAVSLERRRTDLFDWLKAGELKVHIHGKYPLKDAAVAHRALEGRETIGKVLLVP